MGMVAKKPVGGIWNRKKKIITLGYDITVWEVLQTYFLLSTIQKKCKKKINKSKCKSAELLKKSMQRLGKYSVKIMNE